MTDLIQTVKNPLGALGSIYTDQYELTMAQGYFKSGKYEQQACFDYFFRKVPCDGGYVVFSGLDTLLEVLSDLCFDDEAIAYLAEQGFANDFLEHLRAFRFEAEVLAPREGELVFPFEPVVRVRGGLLEAQIVESALLNVLNFESLIATKASRLREAAGPDKKVIDFGLRRAQGFAGMQLSRAAVVGGCDSTSNVFAGYRDGIPITGTQAHSWIQSFDTELEAFRTYADAFPEKCILLVDTYDTLESGVPNAITVGKEMEERGERLDGIRLDSGDLAWLAKRARKMLDDAGLDYVKIAASNQLDEHVIKSLLDQDAPIDAFGVGTRLVTSYDCPALDGVYKLSQVDDKPRLKLSESRVKVNFPGHKQVLRLIDEQGMFYGDCVVVDGQTEPDHMHHPFDDDKHVAIEGFDNETLLRPVMNDGEVLVDRPSAHDAAAYAQERLDRLPGEHKRFQNPHVYKVGLSEQMRDLRDRTLQTARKTHLNEDR
ncbi:nicotinate phosphoribosyltransferase [Persicimonas caeni]|uniref:Nicotinate phosphoribosyltransferase n=1 Tax=Persicimonas caeni TaxID=2292766 RepID=A0A4Y6PYS8_PERCE|nr:nicotinate phosphoribosyltransferase [Persicimonas caeni]QDG52885.1 nicotinate phosphoribosyltransferase [Persicimonas caeni]QED34107.1 nicotinate phosphoribosyltransferase [Persicimonas caeni]